MDAMNALGIILKALRDKRLPHAACFEVESVDSLLEQRETDPFDGNWVQADHAIRGQLIPDSAASIIEIISKESFLRAYEYETGQILAPFISDDFRLIAQCIAVSIDDRWVSSLLGGYLRGVFPCGQIAKSNKSIDQVIFELS